jgi:drug/metabolite transporter (DMT)-like permease
MASLIGALVLHQIPSAVELTGIGLVIGGVLIHRTRAA